MSQFFCQPCNKAFSCVGNLNKHLKTTKAHCKKCEVPAVPIQPPEEKNVVLETQVKEMIIQNEEKTVTILTLQESNVEMKMQIQSLKHELEMSILKEKCTADKLEFILKQSSSQPTQLSAQPVQVQPQSIQAVPEEIDPKKMKTATEFPDLNADDFQVGKKINPLKELYDSHSWPIYKCQKTDTIFFRESNGDFTELTADQFFRVRMHIQQAFKLHVPCSDWVMENDFESWIKQQEIFYTFDDNTLKKCINDGKLFSPKESKKKEPKNEIVTEKPKVKAVEFGDSKVGNLVYELILDGNESTFETHFDTIINEDRQKKKPTDNDTLQKIGKEVLSRVYKRPDADQLLDPIRPILCKVFKCF